MTIERRVRLSKLMFLVIVSLIVVVPFVELYVIVKVGSSVGFLPTIATLIAISIVGSALIKHEGLKVYNDFTSAVQRGQKPSKEIVHGVCLLAAGVLLLAPGFISDVVAILLMLPPVRAVAAAMVLRKSTPRVTVIRATHTGPIVETREHLSPSSIDDVIDVEPREGE